MWTAASIVALGVVAAGAILWIFVQRRRHRRQFERQRERHRRQLDEVRREARARIERLERRLDEARERGHLEFASDLLGALDALDRADRHFSSDLPESVRTDLEEGLAMVRKQLQDAFRRHDLEPVDPEAGERFDPEIHEAWGTESGTDYDAKTVLRTHRKGWVFDDLVVRAAAVDVAVAEAATNSDDPPSVDDANDEASAPPSDRDDSADSQDTAHADDREEVTLAVESDADEPSESEDPVGEPARTSAGSDDPSGS